MRGTTLWEVSGTDSCSPTPTVSRTAMMGVCPCWMVTSTNPNYRGPTTGTTMAWKRSHTLPGINPLWILDLPQHHYRPHTAQLQRLHLISSRSSTIHRRRTCASPPYAEDGRWLCVEAIGCKRRTAVRKRNIACSEKTLSAKKERLFTKQSSKLSFGAYMELYRGISVWLEAIADTKPGIFINTKSKGGENRDLNTTDGSTSNVNLRWGSKIYKQATPEWPMSSEQRVLGSPLAYSETEGCD